MPFIDQWQAQVGDSLIECAKLAPVSPDVDLKFQLMVVGVLWPIRQPVQDFEIEAMGAVKELVNDRAKFVLQLVQNWENDRLAVAKALNKQELQSGELGAALNVILSRFGAFPIFAQQLANQSRQSKPADTPSARPPAQSPRVLVSYSRLDGEAVAAEVYQRLQTEQIAAWDDLTQIGNEESWWQKTIEALEQVDFLVLVMTPAATESPMVRRQWRYARQRGVCIYPVFQDQNLDFSRLPRWIRQVHFYNLNLEWHKLLHDLKGECAAPPVPFMVDALPDDYITRPAESNRLVSYLYDPARDESIINTVVLVGAGGYGKTTLAMALCHHQNIRQVFDNGVLWVTLGETPGDLSRYVIDLIEVLSGERPGFAGLDAAVVRLGELLADRDILLVIDDVWNVSHLKPFLQGGSRCARLITTRDTTAAPPGAKILQVGPMQQSEAQALLGNQLPPENPAQLQQLAARLGEWPLLLKLTNGTLRERLRASASLAEAVAYVNDALDKHGLTAFDKDSDAARDQAAGQTIKMSLELLSPERCDRYFELAIFPEDINIPFSAVEKLWSVTGGLDDFDTEELCDYLHELSLLVSFDLVNRNIRLHKVMRSYLVHRQHDNLPNLHRQFLDACQPASQRWADLPPQEPYLWTHLAYHLVQAERSEELLHTVKNLFYLAVKTHLRGSHYTESDLQTAESALPEDNTLKLLRRTLSQAGHLLARCASLGEISNTLHSRLAHRPQLAAIAANSQADLPRPLLTARHTLPDLPDPHLIRTLRGHTAGLLGCAITADGATAVSVAKDNTVIVWDTATGIERLHLAESTAEVWGCALSANGAVMAYVTGDGRIVLWDPQNEVGRISWAGHQAGILSCALDATGSLLVTAAKDKTLKVWDTQTGAERATLAGHQRSVTDCALSADGQVMASASNDGLLKVWDVQTGKERFTATIRLADVGVQRLTFSSQRDAHFTCALSADGAIVAGASSMGTVTVWNTTTGAELITLKGDKRGVQSCALSANGSRVACALTNGRVKMWDTATGGELLTLVDHTRSVNDCVLSADGATLISASDDQTLKVWDVGSSAALLTPTRQLGAAHSCAISADGTVAVTAMADNTLVVWDVAAGSQRLTLKGHTRKVNHCAITPNGQTVVSASQDQTLIIWDAQTGSQRSVLTGHTWAVNGCAISADGGRVISVSDDKTLKVWDARTGQEQFSLTGHSRNINSCAFNDRRQLAVSASGDGTLRVWSLPTKERLATLKGHTAWVDSCAISADGQVIVSASYDKTLKLWNANDYTERITLRGHTMTVAGCAISADGAIVISASRDKTIKVWDAPTGRCLTTLFVDEPLSACACTPDAATIIAAGNSGVYFLRLER